MVKRGLTAAEVADRKTRGLVNTAPAQTTRTYTQIFRENVFTFINNVLIGLGIALVMVGRSSDAVVSVGVILVNVVVSVVQEIRAKRTLDRIALLTRPTARVDRDGLITSLDPNEIVVGDLLLIEPGDQIIVDGNIVDGTRLDVDESLITGETDLVPKRLGDPVYSGSFCVNGSAYYEAQKVGAASLANQLTTSARSYRRVLTPLQKQINLVVRVLLLIVIYLQFLLLVDTLLNHIAIVESVKMSVVIAGLIPNGLFLAIAVAYALGAVRIAGKGALVQESNAIESLSNVDVLCLDKTGTLTANRIRFHDAWAAVEDKEALLSVLGDFTASISTGNRTSAAIAAACPGRKLLTTSEVTFSSAWKWSGLVFDDPQRRGTYILGAPEILKPYLEPLREIEMAEIQLAWANRGLRVVIIAWHPQLLPLFTGDETGGGREKPELPEGLIPLGLVCLEDELRPEAAKTLADFARAGVQVKIISGDKAETVAALARQAGLSGNLRSVSGLELSAMDSSQLAQAAEHGTIFGRITPQQKELLIKALKSRGHYVAMVGDGVNDVLSLKQANLGIAMQGGSQAARSVADIILLGDSFSVIPTAVQEGQRILSGMQNILKIFMTRILYVTLLVLSTAFIGGFPFSPKQSSLLALLTVGIPTLALAAWARPAPVPRVDLTRWLLRFVVPAAVTLSLASLFIYVVYLIPVSSQILQPEFSTNLPIVRSAVENAQSATTNFSVICGLLLLLFVEPPTKFWVGGNKFSGDWRPTLLAAGLLIVYGAIVFIPGLGQFFDLKPQNYLHYLLIISAAALWTLLLRWIWRARIVDRFLNADLS
jgi:cation-transporting P-type ATPase E